VSFIPIPLIPAKAGTPTVPQFYHEGHEGREDLVSFVLFVVKSFWVPAFAGMSGLLGT
jgi:hypothetical protein